LIVVVADREVPAVQVSADKYRPEDRESVLAEPMHIDPDELPQPGLSAYEMLDRLGTDGGVRALWVMASNVVVSAPRSAHVAERVRALDFLVVSDFFLSETAAMADVVLPTAQWAEEDGTMTNLEGRVILREAALTPPPGVRTDLQVMRARGTSGPHRFLRRSRRGVHRVAARQRGR
jgi:anaerobic selenocysteine-containing dehydrogenase